MHTAPALIIIDMQQGMSRPEAGPRNNPQAEANIAQLLHAWRQAGAPLVHVRHISRTRDRRSGPASPASNSSQRWRRWPANR